MIGDFAARVQQGLEQLERERFAEAEQSFRAALAMNPRDDQLLHLVGVAQLRQGRAEEALKSVQRAISLAKRKADYHNTLGCALRDVGRADEAVTSFERALKLAPDSHEARYNLAQAMLQVRRFDEASALFEGMLAVSPGDIEALAGLARAKWTTGKYEPALDVLRNAIADAPGNRYLRFSLSELLLALGDFDEGWREYLQRPSRAGLLEQAGRRNDETHAIPRLPESLEGQTVRLHGEQGLGDELFFLRFAAELRARGAARVEAAVDARLADMVSRSGVVDACLAKSPQLLRDPGWALIGDLPYLLGSSRSYVPPALPLNPLQSRFAEIGKQIAGLARPLVGLTWRAGTPPGTIDYPSLFKDLPFDAIAAFAAGLPGTVLVLQRHPRAAELEQLALRAPGRIVDFSGLNEDLEGMLALLAQIDEYVGVSNTNTHMFAGVGGRGRVLVPVNTEFRWMAQGRESPWFPGFTIYRPGVDRNWSAVLEQLRDDLVMSRASGDQATGGTR